MRASPSLISRTRTRARDLADDLDRARDLAYGHDLTSRHVASRAFDRACGFIGALDRARDLVGADGDPLAVDLDRAFDRARALIGALDRARDRARDLEGDLALADDFALALTDARDRAVDLTRALELVYDPGSGRASRRERDSGRVAPIARHLVAAAVRLLPEGNRARYAEEFRSDLWEIVHDGGRRRAQLAYAARQVMSARQLRAELRVPRRRGAAP